jgi:hypothetical protein
VAVRRIDRRFRATRQPTGAVEVDRKHPLANGLVYAVNFGNGGRINHANNQPLTHVVTGTLTRGPGPGGMAITSANGLVRVEDPANALRINSGPVSHAGFVRLSSIDYGWGGVFSVSDGTPNQSFSFQNTGTVNQMEVGRSMAGSAAFSGVTPSLTVNRPLVYVITSAGPEASDPIKLWVEGKYLGSANLTSKGAQASGTTYANFFSERSRNTAYGSDGDYYGHYAWNRLLSDAEALEISQNFWQIFRAPSRVIYSIPAGGAATGQPKIWTGSTWVNKPAKVWNGSAWVEKPAKVYNGSTWVLVN